MLALLEDAGWAEKVIQHIHNSTLLCLAKSPFKYGSKIDFL